MSKLKQQRDDGTLFVVRATESVTIAKRVLGTGADGLLHHLVFHRSFPLLQLLLFIAIWHLVIVEWGLVNRVFFPAPWDVVVAFPELADADLLYGNLAYSARNWLLGYVTAVIFGVLAGALMGTFRAVDGLLGPLAWSLWAAPLIAIRPMTTIWFGFGATPIVFLVFLSAVFPILLNTATGIKTVDVSLLRAGRVFGASWWELYRKVRLPWTRPYVFAGMRTAIPTSVIGLLVGELVGSPKGLGAVIMIATSRFKTEQAFAAIVMLVVFSVGMVRLLTFVERLTAPWIRDDRG